MVRTTTVQIRQRGTFTLPRALREKYRLADGDRLTLVDLGSAMLLAPRLLVVPKIAAELERLRKRMKLSLRDLRGASRKR